MDQSITEQDHGECHHAPNRIFSPFFVGPPIVTCNKCCKPIQLTKESRKPMVIFELLMAGLNFCALILALCIPVSTPFYIVHLSLNAVGAGLGIFITYRCCTKGEYRRARIHPFDRALSVSASISSRSIPIGIVMPFSVLADEPTKLWTALPILVLTLFRGSADEEFVTPETAVILAAEASGLYAFSAVAASDIYRSILIVMLLLEIALQCGCFLFRKRGKEKDGCAESRK